MIFYRCFYCDRVTADEAKVRMVLRNGRLACVECLDDLGGDA